MKMFSVRSMPIALSVRVPNLDSTGNLPVVDHIHIQEKSLYLGRKISEILNVKSWLNRNFVWHDTSSNDVECES